MLRPTKTEIEGGFSRPRTYTPTYQTHPQTRFRVFIRDLAEEEEEEDLGLWISNWGFRFRDLAEEEGI